MLGLKTQESVKFKKFFSTVQNEANKLGKVFFLECEDGHEKTTDDMEMCNLQGWLIPAEAIQRFIPIWENDEVDDTWNDEFSFVEWNDKDGLTISFLKE